MENEKKLNREMEQCKAIEKTNQLACVLLKNEKVCLRIVDVEKAFTAMRAEML